MRNPNSYFAGRYHPAENILGLKSLNYYSLTKVKPENISFNIFRISFSPGEEKTKPESVLDEAEVQNLCHAGSCNTAMAGKQAKYFG